MIKLNEIVGNFVKEYEIEDFRELSFISNLTHIIDDHKIQLKDKCAKKYVSINRSFKYSYDFLKSIDPRYAEYLIELKDNNVFDIVQDKFETPFSNLINGKEYIYLPIFNCIGDTYSITHETIHATSIYDNSLNRHLFCEVLSILSEMLQRDYFARTTKPPEYNLNNETLLKGLYSQKNSVLLELYLIQAYLEYGYIDQMKLLNILDRFDKKELKETADNLNRIIVNEELSYGFDQRYIIGYLIASYMHDRILDDPKKIEEFIDLNDSLGYYEIEDFLDYLDLEYENNCILNLTDKSYQKLKTSFIHELKRR